MKDYYHILGINRDATIDSIKKAFRISAKSCHPDITNSRQDPKRFREITEAYKTLSDYQKRKVYDKEWNKNVSAPFNEHMESRKPNTPVNNKEVQPDSFFAHTPNGFPYEYASENSKDKTIKLVVHLKPEEICKDVNYPFFIMIPTCPRCHDFHSERFLICPNCQGHLIFKKKKLVLNIPKETEHRTCVKFNMDHVGMEKTSLMVIVLISPER